MANRSPSLPVTPSFLTGRPALRRTKLAFGVAARFLPGEPRGNGQSADRAVLFRPAARSGVQTEPAQIG